MTRQSFALAALLLSVFAVAGPAVAGEFQLAADSFLRCGVYKNRLTRAAFDSIHGSPAEKAELARRYGAEFSSPPAYATEREFRTVTVKPASPVMLQGLPVRSIEATTCRDGECGMAVYTLNFDGLSAAERRQLRSTVARARGARPRPEFNDQGAKGVSVVCDMGD